MWAGYFPGVLEHMMKTSMAGDCKLVQERATLNLLGFIGHNSSSLPWQSSRDNGN